MSSSKRKTSRSGESGEETETDVEAPTTKYIQKGTRLKKKIQKKKSSSSSESFSYDDTLSKPTETTGKKRTSISSDDTLSEPTETTGKKRPSISSDSLLSSSEQAKTKTKTTKTSKKKEPLKSSAFIPIGGGKQSEKPSRAKKLKSAMKSVTPMSEAYTPEPRTGSDTSPIPLRPLLRKSVSVVEKLSADKVYDTPFVTSTQIYKDRHDEAEDSDDESVEDSFVLLDNENEETRTVRRNIRNAPDYSHTFEQYSDKWTKLETVPFSTQKSVLDNMCVTDDDFTYDFSEDNISDDQIKKIQENLFKTFQNNYHYFEHLKSNWGDNIATCFMYSFTRKSIVLVGEHHKIHTPDNAVNKYNYDINLQYDIFYTLIELSDHFCAQLPLKYRPFPFFIEMSYDNEFIGHKRVNSKCIDIIQSDMRGLSGILMCRSNTSPDCPLLHEIQTKILSAQTFDQKTIQSILSDLFFKIFGNEDEDDDDVTDIKFNTAYLDRFKTSIDEKFSTTSTFITNYSEINARDFIVYIRNECLHPRIVNVGDKLCTFTDNKQFRFYKYMKCIAGGIHMTLHFFIDLLQSTKIETDENIRAAFIHLLACINDIFLIPQFMDPSILFCYVWYGNIHIENIYDFLENMKQNSITNIVTDRTKKFGIHPTSNSCMQLQVSGV